MQHAKSIFDFEFRNKAMIICDMHKICYNYKL